MVSTQPDRKQDRICKGRPLKLLETMAKNDYGIEKAAAALNLSRTAADKQLAKIRNYLGAKTNHGALYQAIKTGLITTDDNQHSS